MRLESLLHVHVHVDETRPAKYTNIHTLHNYTQTVCVGNSRTRTDTCVHHLLVFCSDLSIPKLCVPSLINSVSKKCMQYIGIAFALLDS